jgi:hypothetical protein
MKFFEEMRLLMLAGLRCDAFWLLPHQWHKFIPVTIHLDLQAEIKGEKEGWVFEQVF